MAARFGTVLIASYGPGPGVLGLGIMGGPGMMGWVGPGRRGFGGTCNPAATEFAEWRTDRLADLIKPTESQRAKFDDFKAASRGRAHGSRTGVGVDHR